MRGKEEDSNWTEKGVCLADGWAATEERKRKREQDIAYMQESPPQAKQRKEDDGRERATDAQAETSCGQQKNASVTEKVRANAANAKALSFQYVCPACQKSLRSRIRTGEVDHRRACGNRFQVRDGQVVAKAYVYICPACKGNVVSDVKTGKIDHRTVCGTQFSVKDGVVNEKAYVYVCPGCEGNVASDMKTGRINHRMVCGTQFSVKDGVVKRKRMFMFAPGAKGMWLVT